jgi:hypothetical protein
MHRTSVCIAWPNPSFLAICSKICKLSLLLTKNAFSAKWTFLNVHSTLSADSLETVREWLATVSLDSSTKRFCNLHQIGGF